MYVQDTIVAPATAPGQGAVAIVRLSGVRALTILDSLWRPLRAGTKPEPRRMVLGEVIDPATGAILDRAIAVRMPGPRTFTGEDVAELHCHGGTYLVRRILGAAMAVGARMAEPGEFTRRAFLNGRIDLTEAEAIADLVAARGEGALRLALDQMTGLLGEKITKLRGQLISIRAHLEAEIDFADEDIDLPGRGEIASSVESLAEDVAVLHQSFVAGRIAREGARAVILGKPNAGKSSVLNLLLGIERSIVTAVPGTTRDVIEDSIQLGPLTLVLQDTAGVRESTDEVESIGIARTFRSLAEADLVLAVFDASRPLDPDDALVIERCHGRSGVALLNKCDLPPVIRPDDLRGAGLAMPIVPFSARRGDGLESLRTEIVRLAEEIAAPGVAAGVAISRERHRAALGRALQALAAARESLKAAMPPEIVAVDIGAAADALGEITGEIHSEDVLDVIFREFCIGK